MGYKSAAQVLPKELLEQVQEYVDGEWIYIPRGSGNKKSWGEDTAIRKELRERNSLIYRDFLSGESMGALAKKYYLSVKSVQRIIGQTKKEYDEKAI